MEFLLVPPVAFIIYLVLIGFVSGMGRLLAEPQRSTPVKLMTYAGGEAPPAHVAAPGYRPFFVIALFFAILHLGILILGSSELSPYAGIYLAGLFLTLLALILG